MANVKVCLNGHPRYGRFIGVCRSAREPAGCARPPSGARQALQRSHQFRRYQYIQKFDASLLKSGANEVTFTVPAGDVTTGVVWDYLRLELNDGSKAYPAPPDNQRPDYPTLPAAAGTTQAELP